MTCAVDRLPPKIKKHLIGAKVSWVDERPLDGDMDEELAFSFNTGTKPITDMLLARYGVYDPSHIINARLLWEVNIQIIYETPNNKEKSHHIDHHWFEMRAPLFPTCDKFKSEREMFITANRLEHSLVPDGHKNKGKYCCVRFLAKVKGI